jgi:molybdopterin molybdotransferase
MPTSLPSECTIAIATGAALPAGADAVVPFEAVHATSDAITLTSPLAVGQHVFAPGDDAKRGDVLARPGDVVTPGLAGLLASAGFATVAVHRRPRVAIVSTGNEVVGVEDTPARGQIRNSNTAMLVACLERDGAEIVSREHARDAEAQLRTTLQRALEQSDLVITTGGASTGERDLVKGTLRTLGAAFLFDSIALRPARPTGFARVDGRLVATLPGNPAAAYVAYVALVRGVVRRLAGHASPFPATVPARLEGSLHRKDKRHFLMFGALAIRGGAFHVSPLANQCSSLVRTSTDANALIVAEPGSGYSQTGDVVQVEVLDWNSVPITG